MRRMVEKLLEQYGTQIRVEGKVLRGSFSP